MYPASGDVDAAERDPRRRRLDAGSDGVRAKDGVKLAFTVGTTSGNQARSFSEQIIQEQLKKIGVKLTIKNSPDILDTKMVGFDYETIIFAWVGSPDPYSNNVIWLSTSIPAQCSTAPGQGRGVRLLGSRTTRRSKDPTIDTAPQRDRPGTRPGGAGGALQPGRPAARDQRRDRDPAVPEADAARVPQHHHRRGRQPDRKTASPGTSKTGPTRGLRRGLRHGAICRARS